MSGMHIPSFLFYSGVIGVQKTQFPKETRSGKNSIIDGIRKKGGTIRNQRKQRNPMIAGIFRRLLGVTGFLSVKTPQCGHIAARSFRSLPQFVQYI